MGRSAGRVRVDMDSIESAEKMLTDKVMPLRSTRFSCEEKLPILSSVASQQLVVHADGERIEEAYDPEVEWA